MRPGGSYPSATKRSRIKRVYVIDVRHCHSNGNELDIYNLFHKIPFIICITFK